MSKDTFDLEMIRSKLKREPDCDVIIISNNKSLSDKYWKRIEGYLGIKKRPYIVTNSNTWDGLPIMNSLVLKVGKWWENKNSRLFIDSHTPLAKLCIPITFIPPFAKGGEES